MAKVCKVGPPLSPELAAQKEARIEALRSKHTLAMLKLGMDTEASPVNRSSCCRVCGKQVQRKDLARNNRNGRCPTVNGAICKGCFGMQ